MKNSIAIINQILDIPQGLNGEAYLKVFIKNIAQILNIKYAFIGHAVGECTNKIQTDVVWAGDDYYDNFIYDLKDTPCEIVFTGKRVCIHAKKVATIFEKDLLLKEMGVESYVGAPVLDDEKNATGLLVLLDDKAMDDEPFFQSITEFLALRASNEIEKTRMKERLKQVVAQRTLELEEANHEIELINQNLELRIKEEVEKNEQKQRVISEQSKISIMAELIENIAHQWKEPLSTIEAYSSGVKLKKEMNDLSDEFLVNSMNEISSSVQDLSQTMNDFKEFFSSNKNQEIFSLKDVIDRTLKLMGTRMKNSGIQVLSHINNSEVKGFSNEFIQVVLNLLTNSCDELAKQDIQGKYIFIDIQSDDRYIYINIKDNAGGINDELLESIFNPYVSTKKEEGSTGLGLYITKEIIEKHMHGQIEVCNVTFDYENQTHKGAQFTVRLSK